MKKPIILCVDDEEMLLVSLKQQLRQRFENDYRIETAQSGAEALELVEELLEDKIELPLVISDQTMPGMMGDELLAQIHAIAPKTLKILLTGQADVEAVGNAVNHANLYRYISKPWEPTDLNLTVTEALRRYFQDKQLAQRTQELQQKNAFLSMAIHDLKNPLSAIHGFADMITRHFDLMPTAEILEMIEMISENSQQMFTLVKNILEANKIESDKLNLSLSLLDVRPILQHVINHYTERGKAKNLRLQFQCQEKQYHATADNQTLLQVFDNLISNAVKYSPHDKQIFIRLLNNDPFVRCEITDQGPGLSDDDQKQLFGQFTRLTPQPTGGEHSTGLGLFIVKKLVQAMQGKVWCESSLGQGATFIVELPV